MEFCNWAISYEGATHEFGDVEVTSWNIGGNVFRTDDTDRPRTDGRYFGQDFITPGDVEIDVIIRAPGSSRQSRFDMAWAIRNRFDLVWSGGSTRMTPGKVTELTIAGRAVVTGRPRHIDWDDTKATFGIIRGRALFVRGDNTSYSPGDMDQSVTVGLVPPQVGGLIAPLIEPLSTTRESTRARPFTVLGDAPVWPIISVHGPLNVGASVELTGGWKVKLNTALRYDQVAVIDTRPGHQ